MKIYMYIPHYICFIGMIYFSLFKGNLLEALEKRHNKPVQNGFFKKVKIIPKKHVAKKLH